MAYTPYSQEEYNALKTGPYEDGLLKRLFRAYSNAPERTGYLATPYGTLKGKGGSGLSGHDYVNTALDEEAYRGQFKMQPGDSMQDWLNRLERHFPGITFTYQKELLNDPEAQRYLQQSAPNAKGLTPEDEARIAREKERAETMAKIKEFSARLLAPIDTNDPEVKQLMNMASGRALDDARMRGIEGPMSIANSEQGMQGALNNLAMQRKQLGLEALGFSNDAQLQEAQRQDAMLARIGQERELQAAERSERAMAPWKTLGGIVGAVAGGLATLLTGGGAAPALAAAGAGFGVGRGLGGGLGAMGNPNRIGSDSGLGGLVAGRKYSGF